jgi:hypothetical protein
LDIKFVTKLDLLKQMNEVTALDALVIDSQEVRNLFQDLKERITITQEKEITLKAYERQLETSHKLVDKGKYKAISAYKNINK